MALTQIQNTTNQKPSVQDAIMLQGAHKTPLLDWISRGKVTAPRHTWILDKYRKAKSNAHLEITDIEEDTQNTKYVLENAVQIIKNDFGLSDEEMSNAKYGQQSWAYEVAKQGKEHLKDLEYALLGLHHASVFDPFTVGTNSTATKMAGIFHYIENDKNTAFGTTASPLDLTYDRLSDILQPMWEDGGLEDESFHVVVSPLLKKAINRFAGDQYFRKVTGDKKFDPTLYELETDFGTVKVKMHRLFADAKLKNTLLAGQLSEAKMLTKISTYFKQPTTSKTAKFGRYYTSATLELSKTSCFACGTGLK